MRTFCLVLSLAVFCLGFGITAESVLSQSPQPANAGQASPAVKTRIADKFGKLPISGDAVRIGGFTFMIKRYKDPEVES